MPHKKLFAIELYTEALTAGQIDRAVKVAGLMTAAAKDVARNIWSSWRDLTAGQNLPECPF